MACDSIDQPRRGAGLSRRRWSGRALAAMLVGPLAACGAAPRETFDLSAATYGGGARRGGGQIVIAEPIATSPADSDLIMVRPTPETVATLKGAQWTESLPRLLQTRLVQSFENSHSLRSVGRPGTGLEAARLLTSEIRLFEIDVASGQAIVEISVKIVAEPSGQVVAARIFATRVPGSAVDGVTAATALDAALTRTMRDIVAWTVAQV